MALTASTTLNHSAQELTALFADRAFLEHVSSRAGGTLTGLDVSGPTTGAFTSVIERSIPTDRLPDAIRKFVGASLKVTQHESWSAPGADGSRTVDIRVDVAGVPVEVKAVQRLLAQDGHTTVELEGTVSSGIPFLGNKIASAAEPFVGKALKLQSNEASAWLQARS
ncbi:DUF2505 domain-containing protein [Zafaria sp. Z1313]|uniref:DUF2505 domain-containing protein n=1 Tax=unclassified Zafaria TaxID=2828765 RepID=UPI002E78E548|nr:DUF2505 domain-containing protein [Zafaria sp. J156]MEE1619975.1 DUF2505 domain-containing protein [Zafaria sp. J156]